MAQKARYIKPGWLIRRVVKPVLMRLGLVPRLAVQGRRSGRWRQAPVNILELDGVRYLVVTGGNIEWARNL
jgi:hypothetical protein